MAELATALQIDPNHADAWTFLGEVQVYAGKADEGLDHIGRAFRLNPHPPGRYYCYLGLVDHVLAEWKLPITIAVTMSWQEGA
jgi:hypothetical protein